MPASICTVPVPIGCSLPTLWATDVFLSLAGVLALHVHGICHPLQLLQPRPTHATASPHPCYHRMPSDPIDMSFLVVFLNASLSTLGAGGFGNTIGALLSRVLTATATTGIKATSAFLVFRDRPLMIAMLHAIVIIECKLIVQGASRRTS